MKFLRHLSLICIAALAPAHSFAAEITSAQLIALANADRARYGLPALAVDARLSLAAQEKADDMVRKGYFAHISPTGISPWYWFSLAGYAYRFAGENLAVGFATSVDINAAWMQSALHRDNLLNPNYTNIGVATVSGMLSDVPVVFTVEEFGAPP